MYIHLRIFSGMLTRPSFKIQGQGLTFLSIVTTRVAAIAALQLQAATVMSFSLDTVRFAILLK